MRVLAVVSLLVSLLAAGCTQGDPGEDEEFAASCPSWIQGLSTQVFQGIAFPPNTTTLIRSDTLGGGGLNQFQGHPLDQVLLDFNARTRSDGSLDPQGIVVVDGHLEARFYRNDTGEDLRAFDPKLGPLGASNPGKEYWSWDSGVYENFTLQVDLKSPNDTPFAGPVRVDWTFLPNRDGNPNSASFAAKEFTGRFWYRTCSSDGTKV